MKNLYDKTGAAFALEFERDGTAYVRPLVKVITQDSYGEGFHEEIDYEPAEYLVALDRSRLFDAPPIALVNEEVRAKQAELAALKASAAAEVREMKSQRNAAERELEEAKVRLAGWMEKHRVMMDLGKLLDGEVLYPLSVKENPYHHGRDISRIPDMRDARYLSIHSGDFERGQKWVSEDYRRDRHGSPFRFFETKEERDAVIRSEFDAACEHFRNKPDFDKTTYTTLTRLHYGTLLEWVRTHPALAIPDDIKAMKAKHDADLVEQRKAKLAAELAAMGSA